MRKIKWSHLEYSKIARQLLSVGVTSGSPDLAIATVTVQQAALPRKRWHSITELETPSVIQDIKQALKIRAILTPMYQDLDSNSPKTDMTLCPSCSLSAGSIPEVDDFNTELYMASVSWELDKMFEFENLNHHRGDDDEH